MAKLKLRVAILDLNNNEPNRGIGYIKRMVESYGEQLEWTLFDVRHKLEMPDLNFDIYVSSGGPGSPFDFTGDWDKQYFGWLTELVLFNATAFENEKKHVFFICHSFQLACQFFKIGEVKPRAAKSFGTFPCYKTLDGANDPLFKTLNSPFWIADFRDWQVLSGELKVESEENVSHNSQLTTFKILAIEMPQRDNAPRALMAMRFSDTLVGTQFHPEADAEGMLSYFQQPERKETVVKNFGLDHYNQMVIDLADVTKIQATFTTVLPLFFENAIEKLLIS